MRLCFMARYKLNQSHKISYQRLPQHVHLLTEATMNDYIANEKLSMVICLMQ